MKIMTTYPIFLRNRFLKTRVYLVGGGKQKSFFKRMLNSFLLTVSILSILVAAMLMIPDVYFKIFPADTQPIVAAEKGSAWGGDFAQEEPAQVEEKIILPEINDNLPAGNWVVIPRIGVRTEIEASLNPDEALQKGVWMAPEYGRPGVNKNLPIILAAHRFGWQWWWQTDYWKYYSFYKLPELEPGDLVEIIADQRKWTYEIYAGEQGEEITDYEAELILYTCKFLNSPVRYFRYARLIDLGQNTQS